MENSRTCLGCGEPLSGTRPDKRVCSNKCAYRVKRYDSTELARLLARRCVSCDGSMVGVRLDAEFCSRECRNQSSEWKARHKAIRERPENKAKSRALKLIRAANPFYMSMLREEISVLRGDPAYMEKRRRKDRAIAAQKAQDPEYVARRRNNGRKSKSTRKHRKRTNGPVESFDPIEIFERDNWKCTSCACDLSLDTPHNDLRQPTIDHIIPLSKGGAHIRDNCQAMCRSCNSKKSNKT